MELKIVLLALISMLGEVNAHTATGDHNSGKTDSKADVVSNDIQYETLARRVFKHIES
jgi:hypothetical protein